MSDQTITIFATDETARQFLLFQEHFDVFSTMINKGVFNIKNGSVALHFDHNGILQTIQRADVLYSRKHEIN